MSAKKKGTGKPQPTPVDPPAPPGAAIGMVEPRPIVEEMSQSYLDYAMSVIISRALPDVRDGLKPVTRRILYAMWQNGIRPGAKHRKSAYVVGEVLGKYHPHGDIPVYEAMVRMAQDFAMRYPLIDGQGNFGSMDGDAPAAMRYTEARLARISTELLQDIERNTVDLVPNYDNTQREPSVVPARLPNLLLNGTVGIAVGMATNIPPHNLGEIADAVIHLIDHPNATVEDLLQFVKGPDFPTGGHIFDAEAIKQAYATGKGSIVMRGVAEVVEGKGNDFRIVITSIPYQVNKAQLVEHIANLVRDKKLEGIKDLRDESDKSGVRVVVELKRDAYPKKVLNRLYSLTQLQETFHVNTLAIVDGIQPRVLTLKMVLEEYLKHRREVVRRRTEYDLGVAKDRVHILEGLKIALLHIDTVIKTIKQSKDKDEARGNLMKRFKLTERQAVAILEMRLQQLANLERLKIEQEYKEKKALMAELESILNSPKKLLGVIRKEVVDLKTAYADERKTKVFVNPVGEFTQEDLIPNEPAIVVVTRDGYLKRVSPELFKTQGRGGKGVIGLTTKEEDAVSHFLSTTTHADILFFTNRGRVFQLKAYDVPAASRTAKGQAIVNFLQLPTEEKVNVVLSTPDLKPYKFLVMVTKNGIIKKVDINSFLSVRKSGLIAIKLKPGDQLRWVRPSAGKDDVVLITANGQSIRFRETNIREMGRNAAGVRGIKVKSGDEISGMDLVHEGQAEAGEQILVVMANGFGKRTPLKQYKVQGRGGTGIRTAKITERTGKAVAAFIVNAKLEQNDIIVISGKGQVIRLPLKSVSVLGRDTQGVRVMRFSESGDKVASVTFI
ncbi:MAG: DNA gyrase subunit A [Candidatus Kerfeldbacteria bacterium]|nr:DNA gyrase subunit A [Candidatus Kerfeldbacteria bacterium]